MAVPEAAARLRALVDEEVARWSDDFKRGLRGFDIADHALVAERAYRNGASTSWWSATCSTTRWPRSCGPV